MPDTDRNFLSIADVDGRTIDGLHVDPRAEGHDPREFDDILKFSNARNIVARKLWVAGGRENAVDMNRGCRNVRIEDSLLLTGDECAVVIKGGSEDITLANVTIGRPAGTPQPPCDIELGGWSDQSMAKTRRVTLTDVRRADGRPVRVVVGRAERPTIIGGNCRVVFWRSVGLHLFWLGRFLAGKWRK